MDATVAAQRCEQAREFLINERIPFVAHNGGMHLVVDGPAGFIDFWPPTARWIDRKSGRVSFGLQALINYIHRGLA